jgi:hypothetical protein
MIGRFYANLERRKFMKCFVCDGIINDTVEEYTYCTNCSNEYHVDCVNVDDDLCPVCESYNSMKIISDN